MEQMLLLERDKDCLRSFFEERSGFPVDMTLTTNSRQMVSVRRAATGVTMRLHRVFLLAPPDVIEEVAGLVKGKRGRTPLLNAFVCGMEHEIRAGVSPAREAATGRHYDLREIFDSVNAEYFANSVAAPISWGAKRRRRSVRRRTLGSYNRMTGGISINPLLDNLSVPAYYVRFVVYHEMLHAQLGSERKSTRRVWHSKAFREKERQFGDYALVSKWEKSGGV
ncbi:MAG: hypothetical protein AABY51_09715 [Deltaproteobacteria bacterium]